MGAPQGEPRRLRTVRNRENLPARGPRAARRRKGMHVAWYTLEDLGGLVRRHRADDSVSKAITRILRAEIVMMDDIGLLPVAVDAAEGLYRLVDAAYEKRSVAISSNLHPSGFDELMPKRWRSPPSTGSCTTLTSAKPPGNRFGCSKPSPAKASPHSSDTLHRPPAAWPRKRGHAAPSTPGAPEPGPSPPQRDGRRRRTPGRIQQRAVSWPPVGRTGDHRWAGFLAASGQKFVALTKVPLPTRA